MQCLDFSKQAHMLPERGMLQEQVGDRWYRWEEIRRWTNSHLSESTARAIDRESGGYSLQPIFAVENV